MGNLSYIFALFFFWSSHFVFSQVEIKTISLKETPLSELHIQYMYNYGLNMIMYQKPEYSQHSGFWSTVEQPNQLSKNVSAFIPGGNSSLYISSNLSKINNGSLIHRKVPGKDLIFEINGIKSVFINTNWNTQIPVRPFSDSLESKLIKKQSLLSFYNEDTTMHSHTSFSIPYKNGDYYYFFLSWNYPLKKCKECQVEGLVPTESFFIFRYCPVEDLVIPVFMTPFLWNTEPYGQSRQDLFLQLSKDYFCKEE